MRYNPEYTDLPDPESNSAFYENVPTRRLLAWVVDGAITLVLTLLLSVFTLGLGFLVFTFLWFVINLIYRIITITAGSSTIGMRVFGIEFRTKGGQKLSSGTAIAHTALYIFFAGTAILQLLSIVLILGSRYGQSLPDMILGTTAINRP